MPLLLYNFSNNAPINVKPQGGWGGGGVGVDPGEFSIFMEARVKFPIPRHLLNVNFPPWGNFFYQSQDLIIDRVERICLFQPHIVFTATQEKQCQKMSSSARHNNGGQDVLTQT